jgi:hypothetical protein
LNADSDWRQTESADSKEESSDEPEEPEEATEEEDEEEEEDEDEIVDPKEKFEEGASTIVPCGRSLRKSADQQATTQANEPLDGEAALQTLFTSSSFFIC